jgi:hypothetical protein
VFQNFSNIDSPTPGVDWIAKSESERVWELKLFLDNMNEYKDIRVVSAQNNGHVVVAIDYTITANKRGLALLTLEKKMKESLDPAITLWCEPVGDKSKLRALRGVQINTKL